VPRNCLTGQPRRGRDAHPGTALALVS
jgi:hypothetical protein